MFFVLAILCLATVPMALSEKIHERMTVDQVVEIFRKTHHNLVPDYEVMQFTIPRINKRDSSSPQSLTATAFGYNIKLWLNPIEGILAGKNTPVYAAKRNPGGVNIVYKEIRDAMKNVGTLLEDPRQKASLLFKTDSKGQYTINGFIGSRNLVVRSLPESILHGLIQNHSSINSGLSEKSRATRSAYHVVFRKEESHPNRSYKSRGLRDASPRGWQYNPVVNRYPAAIVYPEIMVVVDYNLFALHGNSIERVLIYVLAFWNGVDLLYRSLEEPKFRFNIARIIIATEPAATPYISQSMLPDRLIETSRSYEAVQKYYYSILNVFPADSYDAVMTMTKFQMSTKTGHPTALGIATVGGVCEVLHPQKTVGSVGIITDDGNFGTIHTAAHEFAHLLNASHDEGPNCKPTDGYIMAPGDDILTENFHDFSDCTVKAMGQFLSQNGGRCLYNKPKTINPLPRLLPGSLVDRDRQCAVLERGKNCYTGSTEQFPCTAVYCFDPENPTQCIGSQLYAPPDGTFCYTGKVCLHGQCVAL